MAKKKPNYKNVRQGQTLYFVNMNFHLFDGVPEVCSIFIGSQKEPLPPEGQVITKPPVNFVKRRLKSGSCVKFFFSKRKAKSSILIKG